MHRRQKMQEVWDSVKEWYAVRGLQMPKDEQEMCKRELEEEAKERRYFNAVLMKKRLEFELEYYKESAVIEKRQISYERVAEIITQQEECKKIIESVKDRPPEPVSKPVYGSPEFWKDHWAKKKAAGWKPKGSK